VIKYILAALAIGVATGYAVNNFSTGFPEIFITTYAFNIALYLLLFVMGLSFGTDKQALAKLRTTGTKVLVVPALVILGSLLGGLITGLVFRINLLASMAVTAGYGWYTLTGPLLSQILGTQWGALGFAANFLRELLTIVTITLLAKVDKYAPTASGGATAMDTTLPVIVRYCGSEALLTAFTSGFILSLIAPLTVTAIASLA
jgi:uncharacterized membrane protein YbjE (DUF340 family)